MSLPQNKKQVWKWDRRTCPNFLHDRNKTRKRKYQSLDIEKLQMRRWLLRQARIRREDNRLLRRLGRETMRIYAKAGRLDELHELIADLKRAKVHHLKKVYDKDGNLIPLLNLVENASDYDKDLAKKIATKISLGQTLQKICGKDGIPRIETIRVWYRNFPEFKRQLDEAHTERLDFYLDELIDLMGEVKEEKVGVKQAEFIASQIKWFAERIHPKFMQKKDGLSINVGDEGKVVFNISLAGDTALTALPAPSVEGEILEPVGDTKED